MRTDVPMPGRIARLPVGPNGFRVPWFVEDPADFRVIDFAKIPLALVRGRCWICGDQLGNFRAWVFGALSALQGISTEPPSHLECAEYAMKVCPFLANPSFRRSPRAYAPGLLSLDEQMDTENRGLHCIWVTKAPNHVADIDTKASIIVIGPHVRLLWFKEGGRLATDDERDAGLEQARAMLAERGIAVKRSLT